MGKYNRNLPLLHIPSCRWLPPKEECSDGKREREIRELANLKMRKWGGVDSQGIGNRGKYDGKGRMQRAKNKDKAKVRYINLLVKVKQ